MTTQRPPSTLLPFIAALCLALAAAQAAGRTRHEPRAASAPTTAPTTAQILAPSAATVPDALPSDAPVYRCGNSYSTRPCEGARQVDVADARSEAQRAQGADIAARDKRLAAWLEAGRRAREHPPAASAPTKAASTFQAVEPCKASKKRACGPRLAASVPAKRRVVGGPARK